MEVKPIQYLVIEEVAEMLVSRQLIAGPASFQFSEPVQKRFDELLEQKKMGDGLSKEEAAEVEFLLAAHQMLNVAKIKSLQYAAAAQAA